MLHLCPSLWWWMGLPVFPPTVLAAFSPKIAKIKVTVMFQRLFYWSILFLPTHRRFIVISNFQVIIKLLLVVSQCVLYLSSCVRVLMMQVIHLIMWSDHMIQCTSWSRVYTVAGPGWASTLRYIPGWVKEGSSPSLWPLQELTYTLLLILQACTVIHQFLYSKETPQHSC